jgi:hypothetical protein
MQTQSILSSLTAQRTVPLYFSLLIFIYLFNDVIYNADYIASSCAIAASNMTGSFRGLSWYLPGGAEKDHEESQESRCSIKIPTLPIQSVPLHT